MKIRIVGKDGKVLYESKSNEKVMMHVDMETKDDILKFKTSTGNSLINNATEVDLWSIM